LGEREKAAELILPFAQDKKEPAWRSIALIWLGLVGKHSEPVLKLLSAIAQDMEEGYSIRGAAALALGQLGERGKAVEVLLDLAEDRELGRWGAAEWLRQLGERDKAVDLFISLVHDSGLNEHGRIFVGKALGELGERARAIELLLPLAQNTKMPEETRREAVGALAQLGEPSDKMLDELLRLVRDQDSQVRRHAVEALGRGGRNDRAVLDILAGMARSLHEEGDVRNAAWASLMKLASASDAIPR
jgi:HEAT repeat protein